MRIHPLSGGQRPNKDAAGPAYTSTQPSSTLLWGATLPTELPRIPLLRTRVNKYVAHLFAHGGRHRPGSHLHLDLAPSERHRDDHGALARLLCSSRRSRSRAARPAFRQLVLASTARSL